VARPEVIGESLLSRLLRGVYRADNPYNAFPSLHTGFAVVFGWHWWWLNRRAGVVAACWAGAIVASTVLVHQHYLADVAGGFVVATAASFTARWLIDRVTPFLGRPPIG
jgi:membrane-associated phospholipid phosphatase